MIETNFKHTDIGLIPHDWEVKELEPLCSKLCVGFVGTCEPYYVSAGRGVKMVRTGDLKDSYVDLSNTKFISYDFHRSHLKSQLKRGDILIARHGSNGHGVIYDSDAEANSLNIVILRTESISNKYIIYLLDSPSLRLQIEGVTAGSTQRVINTKEIAKLQIPLPPTLAEQEKIADALSKMDQLVNDLGALIEKKKAIKQGTMQDLLTAKRRLKGFTGEWKSVKIGNIGNTYNGLFGKTASDFGKGEANYITFLNILCNPIIDTTIFEKVQVHPSERQNAVHKGDLFFNTSSETPEEVGICSVILDEIENLYINSFCFGFRILDETIDGKYLAYYFRCKEGRDLMTTLAQGATRYNLSKLSFSQANVTLPPTLAEQRAIANILSSMDTEITNLEQKRDKYIAIKQGMMQNLLTGKIRLI